MKFGQVTDGLKEGKKFARAGESGTITLQTPWSSEKGFVPSIVDQTGSPAKFTNLDLFAEDWEVV